MKTIINGYHVAFDDVGRGPAVLLIHGFPLGRQMWEPQVAALVRAGYRVVTVDLPGFGESDVPTGRIAMTDLADQVAGLMDYLELEPAVVGGMSMGGYVLFALLERHPRKIRAACFIVTKAGADDSEGRERRTRLAAAALEQGPGPVRDTFTGILFAEATPRERPELVREVAGWMEATDPQGMAAGLLAMRDRRDFTPQLGLFELPALVVAAEHDRAIPAEHSRVIADGLPDSTFCLIPGAGHIANLEAPEAFNRCLIDFLQGLRER